MSTDFLTLTSSIDTAQNEFIDDPSSLLDSKREAVKHAAVDKQSRLQGTESVFSLAEFDKRFPFATAAQRMEFNQQNNLRQQTLNQSSIIQDGLVGAAQMGVSIAEAAPAINKALTSPADIIRGGRSGFQWVADKLGYGDSFREATTPEEGGYIDKISKDLDSMAQNDPTVKAINKVLDPILAVGSSIKQSLGSLKSDEGNARKAQIAKDIAAYEQSIDDALPDNATPAQIRSAEFAKAKFAVGHTGVAGVVESAIETIPLILKVSSTASKVKERETKTAGPISSEVLEKRINKKVGTATSTEIGKLEGASNFTETYSEVMSLSQEDLEKSPEYQKLRLTMSKEDAHKALASKVATQVGSGSALLGKAAAKVFGVGLEKIASGVKTKAAGSKLKQTAISSAGEFLEEGVQSGGGKALSNQAIKENIDKDLDTSKGVSSAAAVGAVTGLGSSLMTAGGINLLNSAVEKSSDKDAEGVNLEKELNSTLVQGNQAIEQAPKNEDGKVNLSAMSNEQKIAYAKAKLAQLDEEAKIDLLEQEGKQSPEVIKQARAKLDAANAANSLLNQDIITKSTDADIVELSEKARNENQLVKDFLGDLSLHLSNEDSDNAISVESLTSARNTAKELGAKESELALIDDLIAVRKTSKEVSEDIIIGSEEWRGGRTYLNNVLRGIANDAPAYVAKQVAEVERFIGHMDDKVAAFEKALEESSATGKVVTPLNPEGVPYKQINGTGDMWVKAGTSENVIATMRADTTSLKQIGATINAAVTDTPLKDAVDTVVSNLSETVEEAASTQTEELANQISTFPKPNNISSQEFGDIQKSFLDATKELSDLPAAIEPVLQKIQQEGSTEALAAANEIAVSLGVSPVEKAVELTGSADRIAKRVQNLINLPESSESEFLAEPEAINPFITRAREGANSRALADAVNDLGKVLTGDLAAEEFIDQTPAKLLDGATELLGNAIDDENFGQKEITTGSERVASGFRKSFFTGPITGGLASKPVNAQWLTQYNELAEEGSINKTSLVGNSTNEDLTDNFLSKVQDKVSSLGLSSAEAEQFTGMVDALDLNNLENGISDFLYKNVLNKLATKGKNDKRATVKNTPYNKAKSGFRALFLSNDPLTKGMDKMLSKASVLSMTEFLMTKSAGLTKQSVIAISGLDRKASPSGQLTDYLDETGVGFSKNNAIQDLGNNAIAIAGIEFSGKHANTKNRVRDALGSVILDYMVDAGIFKEVKISRNKMFRFGAKNPIKGMPNVIKLDQFPRKKVGVGNNLIEYNDALYVWKSSNNANRGYYTIATFENADKHTQFKSVDALNTYIPNKEHPFVKSISTEGEGLKSKSGLFSRVFDTDYNKSTPSIGRPHKTVNKAIKNNVGTLSKQMQNVVKKANKTPFYLNKTMARHIAVLGSDNLGLMLGMLPETGETLLDATKALNKSKNLTIRQGIDNYYTFYRDMVETVKDTGITSALFDTPIFFNHRVISNYRLTVDSKTLNYQTNKQLHRFAINLEPRELTKSPAGNTKEEVLFMLGVAQALDISVDKLSPETALLRVHEELAKPEVQEILEIVRKLNKGEQADNLDLYVNYVRDLQLAGHPAMHTAMGLAEYVQYLDAPDKMKVSLPIELDGVNNGPITALVNSVKDVDQLKTYLLKGGISDASDRRTHAQRLEAGVVTGLYEETQEVINTALNNTLITASGVDKQILLAQLRLKSLGKLVALDSEALTVSVHRNETKSIVTEAFYGAGTNSLIRSDMAQIESNFYDQMQNIRTNHTDEKGLTEHGSALLNSLKSDIIAMSATTELIEYGQVTKTFSQEELRAEAIKNRKLIDRAIEEDKAKSPEHFGLGFTLPEELEPQMFINLKSGFGYSGAKVGAFNTYYSDAVTHFTLIREMMNAVAPFARQTYEKAYQEALDKAGYSDYQSLSTTEERAILKSVMKFMPTLSLNIHDDKVDYVDAIPQFKWAQPDDVESASIKRHSLSTDPSGIVSGGQTVTPIASGALPLSTVGIADAAMIAGTIASGQDIMHVFDGILSNTLDQDGLAQVSNLAYFESILNNPQLQLHVDAMKRTLGEESSWKESIATLSAAGKATIVDNIRDVAYWSSISNIIALRDAEGNILSSWDISRALNTKTVTRNKQVVASPELELRKLHKDLDMAEVDAIIEHYIPALISRAEDAAAQISLVEQLTKGDMSVDQMGNLSGKPTVISAKDGVKNSVNISAPDATKSLDEQATNIPNNLFFPHTKDAGLAEHITALTDKGTGKNRSATSRRLNKLIDASNATQIYKDFLKKVLVTSVLSPAFTAKGKFPRIVIQDSNATLTMVQQKEGRELNEQELKKVEGIRRSKGMFDPSTNTIYLHENNGGINIETLMHEMVHSVLDAGLVSEMKNNKDFSKLVNQLQADATKEVQVEYMPENGYTPIRFSAKELFAWGLTNFKYVTALAENKNESVAAARQTFAKKLLAAIRRVIRKVLGQAKFHENSILSFLVEASSTIAKNSTVEPDEANQYKTQISLQDVAVLDPENTFNNLLAMSNNTSKHSDELTRIFREEILHLQTSKNALLKDKAINAMETLRGLVEEGESNAPTRMDAAFVMSPAESYMYDNYKHIIQVGLDSFNIKSQELTKLFNTAKARITPEDFLTEGDTSPEAMAIAQEKWDALFNSATATIKKVSRINKFGASYVRTESEYLAEFVAMAKTNEEVRQVLDKRLDPVKDGRSNNKLSGVIFKIIDKVHSALTQSLTGAKGNLTRKVDIVSKRLLLSEFRAKSKLEQRAVGMVGQLDKTYTTYASWADAAYKKVLGSSTVSGLKSAAKSTAMGVADTIKGTNNTKQAEAYSKIFHELHHGYGSFIPRIIEEVSLTNDNNKFIRRLFMAKNRAIAGSRDGAIKAVSNKIHSELGSLLTKSNSAHYTEAVVNTDLSAITDEFDLQQIRDLYTNPAKLEEAIAKLESRLTGSKASTALIDHAHSMGWFAIHHKGTENTTFPNAISAVTKLSRVFKVNLLGLEKDVDKLSTLVAIQQTSQGAKETLVEAIKINPSAIASLINMQAVQKQQELKDKYRGDKYAQLKGGISEIHDPYRDVRIVPAKDIDALVHDGYTSLGEMPRNPSDTNKDKMFIMYSDIGGAATYQQGAVSTIISDTRGIDNLDGRSVTDGIDDYAKIRKHAKSTRENYEKNMKNTSSVRGTKRNIMQSGTSAVVDSKGNVTAYKYSISAAQKKTILNADRRIESVLPHMYGRTIEASHSDNYNKLVNDALINTYKQDLAQGNTNDYVQIGKKANTKRGREAWRMLPPKARADLADKWGDLAYVRSSLMDQVFGYRKASLANVLRANSDSPQWAKSVIKNTLGLFISDKALIRGIVKGEKALTEISSYIKDWIVVRGLEVLIGNILSNTVQLVLESEGMSIRKAIAYQMEGLKLAKIYQENQSKIRRLEFDISTSLGDTTAMQNTLAQLRTEQTKNAASVLIDAGLLTAIVEDVEADTNPYNSITKLGDKANSLNNKLPESVQWVTRNLAASKESEWYKTAYQFTQIGDFGARYAMYKNLKERNQLTESSLGNVMDSFVNYDLPSNKYLQYLGDVGQVWFLKYFMRIQAVIIKNTINSPRKVMELMATIGTLGVDLPTYYDAFFLFNSITNKLGLMNYAEKGIDSMPVSHVAETLF